MIEDAIATIGKYFFVYFLSQPNAIRGNSMLLLILHHSHQLQLNGFAQVRRLYKLSDFLEIFVNV
jgi:hypothetical protein